MKKETTELTLKISLICKRKDIENALRSRGIVVNMANIKRFVTFAQDCALKVDSDFYNSFPDNRKVLLMNGFTFEKEAKEIVSQGSWVKTVSGELHPYLNGIRLVGRIDGTKFVVWGCHVDDEEAFYSGLYAYDQNTGHIGFESKDDVEVYWIEYGEMLLVLDGGFTEIACTEGTTPMRAFPCCMCPALSDKAFKAGRCENCDFALTFEDERGYRYFVRRNLGVEFKTFYTVPGKARQRSCQVLKQWRENFAAAQEDLNRVAKERGWKPVEKGA